MIIIMILTIRVEIEKMIKIIMIMIMVMRIKVIKKIMIMILVIMNASPAARANMIDQLRELSMFKKWRYSTRRLEKESQLRRFFNLIFLF